MKRWSRVAIILNEPALARMRAVHRAEMMDAMEKRHRGIQWYPVIAWFCTFAVWFHAVGFSVAASRHTRWDIEAAMETAAEKIGDFVYLIASLTIFVTGFMLATLIAAELRRRLFRGAIQRHLATPLCFWCGYTLKGLKLRDQANVITCPECGKESAAGPTHDGTETTQAN